MPEIPGNTVCLLTVLIKYARRENIYNSLVFIDMHLNCVVFKDQVEDMAALGCGLGDLLSVRGRHQPWGCMSH